MAGATKIVELRSENVKRIQAVEIHPRGHVVEISGKNRQGKSSVLDSIAMALGGKDQQGAMPIRKGQDKGKIVVTLDNGMVVTRTLTASGGSLSITSAEGMKYPSPQAMLDKLVGTLSFDPMAFVDMKPTDQRETLKRLVGVDTKDLDEARQETYDERTVVNRTVGQQKARLAGMTLHADAPTAEISVVDLMEKLAIADEVNTAADKASRSVDEAQRGVASWTADVARLEMELDLAKNNLRIMTDLLTAAESEAAAARNKVVDITPIREQIQGSEEINRKVRANAERSKLLADLRDSEAESERLTKRIDAIDAEKIDRLTSAKFPVDGLSFDESGVLFGGIPFNQASSAEQIRVSVAMGLAMNPALKVLLVRNGSLMDEDALALVSEMAQAAGAQVWIERVDSTGTVGIVIEDGMVKKVNEPELAFAE